MNIMALHMRLPLKSSHQIIRPLYVCTNRLLGTRLPGPQQTPDGGNSCLSSRLDRELRRPTRSDLPLLRQRQRQRPFPGPHRSMATTTTKRSDAAAENESPSYIFAPPPVCGLPIAGTSRTFPVRRVYCVGKNYAEHVIEMGGDVERNKPVFFTKPSVDGVVYAGIDGDGSTKSPTPIEYPPNTNDLHYEVELVVAIGREVDAVSSFSDKARPDPMDCVYGYAVGIDLTRRDLQAEAKSKRWPWDTGKYFDQSAPIGPITPRIAGGVRPSLFGDDELDRKTVELTVNGKIRQSARLETMIWKVPEIISELSEFFRLKPGDLIMTGTPSGVGPVVAGDRLVGTIDGLVEPVDIVLVQR